MSDHSELSPDLIRRLLVATQFDYAGEVYWAVQRDGNLRFSLDCSDFFDLACADSEPVETEADIELLEQTLRDLQKAEGDTFPLHLTDLYAARRRRQRPRYGLTPGARGYFGDSVAPLFAAVNADA